jgi:putative ABC transport system substrate-binding protein
MMRRRAFLASAGAALLAPRLARTQTRLPRIALAAGAVSVSDMTETSSLANWSAFMLELRRLGLIEGQNAVLERYATLGAEPGDQLGQLIAASQPTVIFAGGSTAIARAAAAASPRTPVVFHVGDPLSTGLVSNLARPGGNLTGTTSSPGYEIEGKRIELLHEAAPHATRIGYVHSVESEGVTNIATLLVGEARKAAERLGVTIVPLRVEPPSDENAYRRVFDLAAAESVQAVCMAEQSANSNAAATIARLCAAARLPAVSHRSEFPVAGGLMGYGASPGAQWRRVAGYVVRVVNGEWPADMPVLQPEKFDLVVNLGAAKSLGLTLPQGLLLLADEVIG